MGITRDQAKLLLARFRAYYPTAPIGADPSLAAEAWYEALKHCEYSEMVDRFADYAGMSSGYPPSVLEIRQRYWEQKVPAELEDLGGMFEREVWKIVDAAVPELTGDLQYRDKAELDSANRINSNQRIKKAREVLKSKRAEILRRLGCGEDKKAAFKNAFGIESKRKALESSVSADLLLGDGANPTEGETPLTNESRPPESIPEGVEYTYNRRPDPLAANSVVSELVQRTGKRVDWRDPAQRRAMRDLLAEKREGKAREFLLGSKGYQIKGDP